MRARAEARNEAGRPTRGVGRQGAWLAPALLMLWTITVILLLLWVIGFASSTAIGSWIHLLLVLAVISVIYNLLVGRSRV